MLQNSQHISKYIKISNMVPETPQMVSWRPKTLENTDSLISRQIIGRKCTSAKILQSVEKNHLLIKIFCSFL